MTLFRRFGHDVVPDTEHQEGQEGQLNRRLSLVMVIAIIALMPWTAYLAVILPSHFQAHDWAQAWVGFDVALIVTLACTAWAAWTRRQIVAPMAIVAATMLLCDGWFDVNTSFGTKDGLLTMVTAVSVNLPLAILFIFVARHIMLRSAATLAVLTSSDSPPQHARDVKMPFAITTRGSAPRSRPGDEPSQ